MIFLYNALLAILLALAFPFILLKSITNPRLNYKIKERFIPSYRIKDEHYMLFHASSFGEMKALLNVIDIFEKKLKKRAVFSVFTDTGYKLIKGKKVFIMPIDLYPLYGNIFDNLPDIAFFFETEIWPSYIAFLKNKGVKLVLINARMSDKSFKFYKNFSFLFKKIIGKFDIIIAKSKHDAERFMVFSNNVVECGNIKQIKKTENVSDKEKQKIMSNFFIRTKKPILVFGSVHKEETEFVADAVLKLKDNFFIVIAPRHKEDINEFYLKIKALSDITKRTVKQECNNILLIDTIGELEEIYKISDIVFIGGSTKNSLKGHNPIEPLVYNKFIISGKYMDSFKSEVDDLVKENLMMQIDNMDDLVEISKEYLTNNSKIDSNNYFKELSYIPNCYIKHILNICKID